MTGAGAADWAIRPYQAGDEAGILALILAVQRDEFAMAITAEDQPDLADIPGFYLPGSGGFWVAASPSGKILGTIALKDIGQGDAALRKMFVAPSARGSGGPAAALLGVLIDHAAGRGLTNIYLGTTAHFLAAHRFYEKHGFTLVDPADLPPSFPRMAVDNRFYRLALA